jgi:hypothetical protein
VRQAAPDCQFAEVLIKRDKHALLLLVRLRQDVFIAWILGKIPPVQITSSQAA